MSLEEEAPTAVSDAASEEGSVCASFAEEQRPNIDHLIIHDGKPVEGMYWEALMRLMVESLYSGWTGPPDGRSFHAFANVGLFPEPKQTPLVPDVMVSLGIRVGDMDKKEHNTYLIWIMGKPPDVVIEMVSDRTGGEDTYKLRRYATIGVAYYVIYDLRNYLKGGVLRVFELRGGAYEPIEPRWLPNVGLGLTLWDGEYEGRFHSQWLRWIDRDGNLILSGEELTRLAKARAELAEARAEKAEGRVLEQGQEVERLKEKLRAMGVDPARLEQG